MRPAASRGSQGAAAARPCPESCSGSSIRAPSTASETGFRSGSALISATNGKTTTAAMARAILAAGTRLAHNDSGANLVSGVASALLEADGAELGLFEVDEAALPEVAARLRPRAVCLGNLFRDQLDRYGELEHVAEGWRRAVAGLGEAATLVVNADDPLVADLAREREKAVRFGLDDPRHARPALQHAADSKYCVVCGTPYDYAAAYVGHLGDYRCPNCGHARPELDVAARTLELRGLEGVSFELARPRGVAADRAGPPRPLQRLQRARGGRADPCARRVARTRSRRGSRASTPPSAVSSAFRSETTAACCFC